MAKKQKQKSHTWETVREVASALPEAVEGTSYGTPAFHVKKKLFLRLHDSGESIVVRIPIPAREALMKANPESFYITDHYLKHPAMLVRLATVDLADLKNMILQSWRMMAPPKLVAGFEE